MRRSSLLPGGRWIAGTALLGALLVAPIARADDAAAVERIRNQLRRVEISLHAEAWARAEADATDVIESMLRIGAHGDIARELFGLAFAFRAIAEAGLGRQPEAIWDWGAAQLFSESAVAFDVGQFGESAVRLSEDHSKIEQGGSDFDDEDIEESSVVAPVKLSGENPPYPEAARESRQREKIEVVFVIDKEGNPRSPRIESEKKLKKETDFIASSLNTLRDWRFRPATLNGKPVLVYYNLKVRFRLR